MTNRPPRVLIYSHDFYGLGHLRRCRAIAQSLVSYREDLSILMISGSPIVGAFSFSPNVDFIRVPGVVKLGNESYQSHSPGISIEDLMAIRSGIILETARVFEPDIFLVDKEPLGLRGEVEATLKFLKDRGKLLVLGLRDVMDEPTRLVEEWERKRATSCTNLELTRRILSLLDKPESLVRRFRTDPATTGATPSTRRASAALGWEPAHDFAEALAGHGGVVPPADQTGGGRSRTPSTSTTTGASTPIAWPPVGPSRIGRYRAGDDRRVGRPARSPARHHVRDARRGGRLGP